MSKDMTLTSGGQEIQTRPPISRLSSPRPLPSKALDGRAPPPPHTHTALIQLSIVASWAQIGFGRGATLPWRGGGGILQNLTSTILTPLQTEDSAISAAWPLSLIISVLIATLGR